MQGAGPDRLPGGGTSWGADTGTAKTIFAGPGKTCVIDNTSQIRCWGDNQHGWLGHGSVTADTSLLCLGDEAGEMGNALPVVPLGSSYTAVAVSLGLTTNCAILNDSAGDPTRLKCW